MAEEQKEKTVLEFAKAVAAEYSADVYMYSGAIDDDGFGKLVAAVGAGTSQEGALLILTTNGGYANPAYQIARLFQKTYRTFTVCTPSYCKSAGTIIAVGAHKLIMDAFSELGPLDVQLLKQNEIGIQKSGLLMRSSFESLAQTSFDLFEHFLLRITLASGGLVNFKNASEISASVASKLMAPVYAQLNPDIIGSDYRDLQIALHYCQRLVRFSKNASQEAVMHLVNGYPSHDFIIDDEEAGKLFRNVSVPSEQLYDLIGAIGLYTYDEAPSSIVKRLDTDAKENEENEPSGTPGPSPKDGKAVKEGLDESGGADRTRTAKQASPPPTSGGRKPSAPRDPAKKA